MEITDPLLLHSAIEAYQAGRLPEAKRLFEQIAARQKDDARPWIVLAGFAETLEQKLACYQQAALIQPDYPGLQGSIRELEERLAGRSSEREAEPQGYTGESPIPADRRAAALQVSADRAGAEAVASLQALSPGEALDQRQAVPPTRFWPDAAWTVGCFILLALLIGALELPAWLAPARLLLGLVYVLFIPGYWLTCALFPHADDLDGLQRTVLSFGLSLAVISLSALALDRLPWGIRLWPIILSYVLFYAVCIPIALWRRRRLPPDERFVPQARLDLAGFWRGLERPLRLALLVMLGALIVMLITAASIVLLPRPADFFSEFYLLGPEGLAESYPREGLAGQPLQVTAGVTNREGEAHTYRVEAQDGTGLIGSAGPFTLADGETLEQPFPFSPRELGEDVQVDFLLFLDEQTEPYRRLRLFLEMKDNSLPGGP